MKKTTSKQAKSSYSRFIGFEVGLTVGSLIAAVVIAQYLYPVSPGLFQSIANLVPSWLGTVTGFAAAYAFAGVLVWIVSNSLLFLSGLRRY